jgi:cysteinyl-tRNA synthetase
MSLRIYNTLNRKKEAFQTLVPDHVSMYVCGPTVYDSCHIGHARSTVVFDMIYRYLVAIGYKVTYVRNFTDVDDKIIQRANQLNVDAKSVAEKYIEEFYRDMDALYVQRATFEPKVTDHIDQIIAVIQRLIDKGIAYQVDGNVYFSVKAFENYGTLSGRQLEDMRAGARVNIDEKKKDPFDFALWKASKPKEPHWNSPWGRGRPGWHIECSAMGYQYLGERIDIHGGGKDLIFPHHENEIAQSEAAFGKNFVTYWVHNGFVNIDQEKMSKSLGNFLLIKDVLAQYHPEVIRLFLLSKHYRKPIDFSDANLREAESGLNKIYTLALRIENEYGADAGREAGRDVEAKKTGYWRKFRNAMDDDFNSAKGTGLLFEAVRQINRWLDAQPAKAAKKDNTLLADWADILKIGDILGILNQPAHQFFEWERTAGLEKSALDADDIREMVAEREAARKNKDWAKADIIREKLEKMNVLLEDRPDGTVWKIKS